MKNYIIVFLFLILVTFVSCSDDPSSVGADLFESGKFGELLDRDTLDSQKDTVSQKSMTFQGKKTTFQDASRALLGKISDQYSETSSSILMRFSFAVSSTHYSAIEKDSLRILEAYFYAKPNYVIGTSNGQFDFEAREILKNWSGDKFNKDSLAKIERGASIVVGAKSISDSLVKFNVSKEIAAKWLGKIAGIENTFNYGVIFEPTNETNKVMGFFADHLDYEAMPEISIIVSAFDASPDTIKGYPLGYSSSMVHVVDGNLKTTSSDRIILHSGIQSRGYIYFDLSKLPPAALIESAILTLTIDSSASDYSEKTIEQIVVAPSALKNQPDSLFRTSYVTYLYREKNAYIGEIKNTVQDLVNREVNYGFRLNSLEEVNSLSRFVFFGSDYADVTKRPKLIIHYTKKNK